MTNSQPDPNLSEPEEQKQDTPASPEKAHPVPTTGSTFLFVIIAIIIAVSAIWGLQKVIAPSSPAAIPASTSDSVQKTPPTSSATEGITAEEAIAKGVFASDGDGKIIGYQVTTTEEGVQFRVDVENISDVAETYEVVATGDKGAFPPVGETITLQSKERGNVLVEVERLPEVTTAITLSLNGRLLGTGLDEQTISLTSP